MQRGRRAVVAVVLGSALLVGCGNPAPTQGDVAPTPLGLTPPTYALATPQGLVVRAGEVQRTFRQFEAADWLPGGRALLRRAWKPAHLWDPATGAAGGALPFADPNRSVEQIAIIAPEDAMEHYPGPDNRYRLVAYDLSGDEQWRVDLPRIEDDPDAKTADDAWRQYLSAHTIDGATFLRWGDSSESDEVDGYGVLRVADGGRTVEQVQEGTPIIALWLAADGSALLATKRVWGDPCGGCEVTQQLIEIDPEDGSTLAEYDLPGAYEKTWDVREVDKVGGRIAVRFEEAVWADDDSGDYRTVQRGTWVLDEDGWSMVAGSDREISWWQGPEDRIVGTPLGRNERTGRTGDTFSYAWEHAGERTPLKGLTLAAGGKARFYEASIPGQLLPPES